MAGLGGSFLRCRVPNEVSDMPESNRFEALLLFLMSLMSIAVDLLRSV